MPDLNFQITGVEASSRSLTPLLEFKLALNTSPAEETVQGVLLHAQIQFECPQRHYNDAEKEKLLDLFGTPDRWGQTLRNRLWTHANATVGQFTGNTELHLPVPCTFDLNIAAAKYFYALETAEIPLLFLFSGSVFYTSPEGRLQVQRISWNKECAYRIPVQLWRELMEQHYPNTAWLYLHRDVFDQLHAYKLGHGLATCEDAIRRLLNEQSTGNFAVKIQHSASTVLVPEEAHA
jgi:hypothetical protein